MNILFICSLNQWRSPTAEQIFKNTPGLSVGSAGTASNARRGVNSKDIEWADIIFVMEQKHADILYERFRDDFMSKHVVNLNIPDEYEYMDPDLIAILEAEVPQHLNLPSATV